MDCNTYANQINNQGRFAYMNKKILLGVAAGLVATGAIVFTPLMVNAQTAQSQTHGGRNSKGSGNGLEVRAQAMDMAAEQLKEQLQTKNMSQVISDQGMTTEQFQENVREAANNRWQEMGLSDEEIQERTEKQQERQANCEGSGLEHNQYGYRNNR